MTTPEVFSLYPRIDELTDSKWVAHPERLLISSLDEVIVKSNTLGNKTPPSFPPSLLARLSEGLLLDVGCGINFGLGCTMVDLLPNAYGIDPAFIDLRKYPRIGDPPKDRIIGGYAEDIPFRDKLFRWTLSFKCVGWYPNITVNAYWAISEMVRVTEDGGLVMISIGQKDSNGKTILEAAQKIKEGPLGKRMDSIKDFTSTASPQISIRLTQ